MSGSAHITNGGRGDDVSCRTGAAGPIPVRSLTEQE